MMMMMMMMMMILDQISAYMDQNLPAVCMPQIDASNFCWSFGTVAISRFNDGMMVVQLTHVVFLLLKLTWTPRIGVMIKP